MNRMISLADRIRRMNTSPVASGQEPAMFDYNSFKEQVQGLQKTQMKINKKAIIEKGGSVKAYALKAQDALSHAMGGNGHTLPDLFDQQLENLDGLNGQLDSVTRELRSSITTIEAFQDDVYADLFSSLEGRTGISEDLEQTIAQLERNLADLEGWQGEKTTKYFQCEQAVEHVQRTLSEQRLGHSLNADNLVMSLHERVSIAAYLATLRAGYNNCARLHNNVNRTQDHLKQVKVMYQSGSPLKVIASEMFKGLHVIGQLTQCIYSEFESGMVGAKKLLSMSPARDLFGTYGRKMQGLQKEIEEAAFVHDKHNEEVLAEYLT